MFPGLWNFREYEVFFKIFHSVLLLSYIFGPSVVKYDIQSNSWHSKLHAVIDCLFFNRVATVSPWACLQTCDTCCWRRYFFHFIYVTFVNSCGMWVNDFYEKHGKFSRGYEKMFLNTIRDSTRLCHAKGPSKWLQHLLQCWKDVEAKFKGF